MDIINISVAQSEVDKHLACASAQKPIQHSIEASDMPELKWQCITALGFGYEKDKGNANADTEDRFLDYAASLFASCGQTFSLICEKNEINGRISYAVGCEDGNLALRLLKSAFGTVKYNEYSPRFDCKSGRYAYRFEAVRTSAEELDKRESFSSVHISKWADAVSKALTVFPGMVRMDFQPVEADKCEKLLQAARRCCDEINTYLESNIQAGAGLTKEIQDDFINKTKESLIGTNRDNNSYNASVSWKNVSSELSDIKKEAEYFIQLFSDCQKQGWTVNITVSADIGTDLYSEEKEYRENALAASVSAAFTQAGYSCSWKKFSEEYVEKENDALLLPASYVTELISFPTTSFYGFERKENRYYSVNLPDRGEMVPFAPLIQYDEKTAIEVGLPKEDMNRHSFICGMTGSGKTNTVHCLLSKVGDLPFLIIEPVKGEYHSLPGVTYYTMTAGSENALYLNPFWFPEGSSLQYHIDYLKQIISSAFDLSAAMPNILEQCLVLVYQHCGWDFIQNKNRFEGELPESMLYPTFSDLCQEVDNYITNAKFGNELRENYRGALLSRLQSFTSGPKGTLLNTSKHLPCDKISEEKIVISLDSLADDSDKAIVMGVIVAQYFEYLKKKCAGSKSEGLQHLVVIEEAHHLFSADAAPSGASAEGGSGQSSSADLVKTLNNMLAEIRSYGEGFIIVDQSPSALHPSVLKNTAIKIAHRVDYKEDVETMQEALLLDADDKELATLLPGQALVHYGGMHTAAKVKVDKCETKENSEPFREKIIGSSIISTLTEDEKLTEDISSRLIDKVINQLLFDDINNCKNVYKCLLAEVRKIMIKFGYPELIDQISEGAILAEYITSLLPARLEEMYPHQYCTCKMLSMFIGRYLSLSAESNGELSKYEISAFENYRTHRLEPRIRIFFKYTDDKNYCIFTNGYSEPKIESGIVLSVIKDLVAIFKDGNKSGIEAEIFNEAEKLISEKYFLYMPENPTIIDMIKLRLAYFLRKAKESR